MTKSDFNELFGKLGIKNTRQRNIVLRILDEYNVPMTAELIYIKLREKEETLSLSTVYRIMENFIDKGLVIKTKGFNNNKAMFEVNRREHKHHVICMDCKTIISIHDCPLEEYEKTLEDKTGFAIESHKLEIFGYCSDCKKYHQV